MRRETTAMDLSSLPEGCIANVLSLTSPRDACRLSLVASSFRSAAESDALWETFLPEDHQELIGRSADPSLPPAEAFKRKKDLYLHLCDHPLIIDGGTKSFSLEKWSGKKCYMLAARDLKVVWGDTPQYWTWSSLSESRFAEVAELLLVFWLEIRGKINTSMLSPNTPYAAYLVFKFKSSVNRFECLPAEGWAGISDGEGEKRIVYLDPDARRILQNPRYSDCFLRRMNRRVLQKLGSPEGSEGHYPKKRGDGWLEIELGEYANKGGGGELEMSLMEVKGGFSKGGLIVQGIEIRPK